MIEGQISIFDKPKVMIIEDCTSLHPLLAKGSIHDVYLEKESNYIILIDGTFYGVYKYKARKC